MALKSDISEKEDGTYLHSLSDGGMGFSSGLRNFETVASLIL
jgi:hypothetical protein